MAGEGRGLAELPKGVLLPIAMVLLIPKKGCMHEQGQGNSQRGQENRSGEKRRLMPLRSEFRGPTSAGDSMILSVLYC
jgi:hypothetical protein